MTNATTNVARVAAAVAGFGLVAMSFAPLAGAQTATTTTTTTTTTSATFTRDLTLGSTGADVTALQNWLIAKGFSIPAGATGYFGAQTKAALAAYQAANAITPAAGYFGPITRAKVMAAGGSTTGTTGGTTTTSGGNTLSGGEADLRNYDFIGGDDLADGEEDVEIAVAKFDVEDGDIEIQRVTLDLQAAGTPESERPWDYIDTLSVYLGSEKIGDVEAGSKSDWDRQDDDNDHAGSVDYYSIDIPVEGTVDEGDRAELSIRADAQSIDTDDQTQTFYMQIPEDGIRAVDAEGIQQYVSDGEEATLGFDEEESGDLTLRESDENPEAGVLVADEDETSDEFDLLAGTIRNKDDADVDFDSLTFTIAHGTSDADDVIRRATLTLDGDEYDGDITASAIDFDDIDTSISGDDTIDFVLSVELYGQSGHYTTSGEYLTASLTSGNVEAEGADSGDDADVSGSVNGEKQSISVDAGLNVNGKSDNAVLTYNSNDTTKSYGTYTLKFDVTADGDDIFVPKTAASTTGSTTYAGVIVSNNVENSFSGTSTVSLSTTADSENSNFYVVRDGDTETFTVTVTLDPSATGTYAVGLDMIKFSTTATDLLSLQSLDVDQTDDEFRTDALAVQN